MKKSVTLKRIMMVVYKTNRNTWRGFCAPFDVSGEFRTEKGAKDGLIEMVEIYMNGLKEFSYPNHLVNKRLSNPEDVVVHEKLKKVLSKEIQNDSFTTKKTKEIPQYHYASWSSRLALSSFKPNFA